MILLVLFAFFAGIVTILSPCILPVLPIVLSGSLSGNKHRPLGIVLGFIASFTFFTLFLSLLVSLTHFPANVIRSISVVILFFFGLSLLIPKLQVMMETFFSSLTGLAPSSSKTGFLGGIVIGLSLGLLWTPCVGPILASVISLALTNRVTIDTFIITLSYAIGTALPMFVIMLTGRKLFQLVPSLLDKTTSIQKVFGVLMVLLSVGLFFGVDRTFQTWVLNTFPSYGTGLTLFEQNSLVKSALQKVGSSNNEPEVYGGTLAPEVMAGGQWFNLPEGKTSLKLSDLRGKVVLIDFWTYTCINCQRTFPYLKSWWEKYEDQGLVIIGVHAPEFEFEKDAKNVAQALNDFGITYPVVQDNDFATWNAYKNDSWPSEYLIDKDGKVRYHEIGEGRYAEKEKNIQTLLNELHPDTPMTTEVDDKDYQLYSRTPETYLGYYRMQGLTRSETIKPDIKAIYTAPNKLDYNTFALDGVWAINRTYAIPEKDALLFYHVDSKDVYLLMEPVAGDTSAGRSTEAQTMSLSNGSVQRSKVKILVDNKTQFPGADVKDGIVIVDKSRLYHIARFDTPGEHIVTVQFLDGNVHVYTFTFG